MSIFTFKRKIYAKMLEWKSESRGRTAMLIEGARRIGKSTIVEEFAKREYETYILIDFNKAPKRSNPYSMTSWTWSSFFCGYRQSFTSL